MQRFAAQASRERQQIWRVTVTATGINSSFSGAKSPTQLSRVPQEQGGGWVQRAIATFNFPVVGTFRPEIGTEITIASYVTASEIGSVWRCFDLTRGDANTGTDHRMVCYRLD